MGQRVLLKHQWREYKPLMAAAVALSVLLGWLLFGATGLFAWGDYSRALEARRLELNTLKHEQARLENRRRLLDPRHVDPDLGEELVREQLNLIHPDDIVIPIN